MGQRRDLKGILKNKLNLMEVKIQHKKIGVCVSHSVMSDSLQSHGPEPARFLCPRNSSGKNTGVDCHSLLQGIFSTQGLNLGLLYCRQILYHLSHQGSPEQGVLCKSMCIEDKRD